MDTHAVGTMNNTERLYLTRAAIARAAGLDPRSKEIRKLEPDAQLISTGNKRLDLFKAAFIEVPNKQQEEK